MSAEMDIKQAIEDIEKYKRLNFWNKICAFVEFAALLFLIAIWFYCVRVDFSRATEAKFYAVCFVLTCLHIVKSKHNEIVKEIIKQQDKK